MNKIIIQGDSPDEVRQYLVEFLSRTTLAGREVGAYNKVVEALNAPILEMMKKQNIKNVNELEDRIKTLERILSHIDTAMLNKLSQLNWKEDLNNKNGQEQKPKES